MIEVVTGLLAACYIVGAVYYALDFLAFQRRCEEPPLWPVAIGIAITWPLIAWQEWTGRGPGGD